MEMSSAEPGVNMLGAGPGDPRGACRACPGQRHASTAPAAEREAADMALGVLVCSCAACMAPSALASSSAECLAAARLQGALHVWRS